MGYDGHRIDILSKQIALQRIGSGKIYIMLCTSDLLSALLKEMGYCNLLFLLYTCRDRPLKLVVYFGGILVCFYVHIKCLCSL